MPAKLIVTLLLLLFLPLQAGATERSVSAAESLINEGKDLAAISMLNELVKADRDDYQAWFLLGVTQARKRHFDDAIKAFQQVIRLQPGLAEPHNNLAVIYNEMGNLKAAVRELEASLRLNPDYVTAHENIGDLYVKLAAQSYRTALAKGEHPELRRRYERLLAIRDPEAVVKAETESTAPEVIPVQQPQGGDRDAIIETLEAWRSAWSARDLSRYFTFYDQAFNPGKRFSSLESWKSYKRRVISKRKFINITISNVELSRIDDERQKATFLQSFRADGYQSDDRKQVILIKRGDRWKIIDETAF